MTEEPIRAYVGTYPIARDVTISAEDLQRADAEIEAERARRRLAAEAAAAQAAAEKAAAHKTWRGKLRAMFGRRSK